MSTNHKVEQNCFVIKEIGLLKEYNYLAIDVNEEVRTTIDVWQAVRFNYFVNAQKFLEAQDETYREKYTVVPAEMIIYTGDSRPKVY